MDVKFMRSTMLFSSFSEAELAEILSSLRAEEKNYPKGSTILYAGGKTERMGLVLNGSVLIESNDMWGNRTVLGRMVRGQFFAETYALLRDEIMLVDVVAAEDVSILFFNLSPLFSDTSEKADWVYSLLNKLLLILANKNINLSRRSFHTSPKTIRGRLMSYLNEVSLIKNSKEFDIAFDRQQLADYLGVERSALSKELGKMQNEGLISSKKTHFIIYDKN